MANYISPLPETKGNTINIPHYHQNNEGNAINSYRTMGDVDWGIPTINSVAQTYDRNEKLKEILGKSLL